MQLEKTPHVLSARERQRERDREGGRAGGREGGKDGGRGRDGEIGRGGGGYHPRPET